MFPTVVKVVLHIRKSQLIKNKFGKIHEIK